MDHTFQSFIDLARRSYHRLCARFRPHAIAFSLQPGQGRSRQPVDCLGAGCTQFPEGKELACAVLSFKNQPGLVAAVQSILAQDEPVEVVVVNSGGGDPAKTLSAAGIDIPVINRQEPLYVGAARNLGIAATRAPYISFLAADCLAELGWARGRLREHRAGALAVSTPVTNPFRRNYFAWASYALLYPRRMPGTPPDRCIHYGVSYARSLFERFGMFREDLRVAEDQEWNERLRDKVPIQWTPDVRTAHRHPTTFKALLADSFGRGRRAARAYEELTGIPHHLIFAAHGLLRAPMCWTWSWKATPRQDRHYLIGAAFAAAPAAMAYSLGSLLSRRDRPKPQGNGPIPLPKPTGKMAKGARQPRILALLQFRNDLRYLPGYFKNVAPQVDGIIALDDGSDDGSTEFVASQPSVLELLRKSPSQRHVWNEPANRRLVIEAAWRHHPDWLLAVDADERLERAFRVRANAEIERAEREGYLAYKLLLRELWDHPDTYRVDGIWGDKWRARLFKARLDHEFDPRLLHGQWAPLNSTREGQWARADLIMYHLKMIDAHDRQARQARYQQIDADRRWQTMGYEYLTDETSLRLEAVPPDRGYEKAA